MNSVEEMSPATGDISPRYAEKTPQHKLVRRSDLSFDAEFPNWVAARSGVCDPI